MLRRGISSTSAVTRGASFAMRSTQLAQLEAIALGSRSFHQSPVRRNKNLDKEEQEELERERQLRQKFINKMGGGGGGSSPVGNPFGGKPPTSFGEMFQQVKQAAERAQTIQANQAKAKDWVAQQQQQNQNQQGGGNTSSQQSGSTGSTQDAGAGGQQQGSTTTGVPPVEQRLIKMSFYDFFVYSTAFYALMILWQFNNPDSQLNRFQGIPWWSEPIDVVCHYLLSRVLLGVRQQKTLKDEYTAAMKADPRKTYSQFLNESHPGLFDGYNVRQQELVAAMCACFASSNDLRFVETMQRSVRGIRDTKKACDTIMDNLKSEFPHVFAPQPAAVAYGQQYQQPMMGGGGGGGYIPMADSTGTAAASQYNFSSSPSYTQQSQPGAAVYQQGVVPNYADQSNTSTTNAASSSSTSAPDNGMVSM